MFTRRKPLNDEIIGILNERPKILERRGITRQGQGRGYGFDRSIYNGCTRMRSICSLGFTFRIRLAIDLKGMCCYLEACQKEESRLNSH